MYPELSSTRALFIAAALAAPWPAFAQNYTFVETSGSFSTISGTGSLLSLSGDDSTTTVSLPFSFPFFGIPYDTVYPSTNGLLAFGAPTSSYSATTIPSSSTPNNFIAGFWADMSVPSGSGAAYSQVTGTTGRRVAIIEWSNLTPLGGSDTITFQIRLYEQTGNIEILYGSSFGNSATGFVGAENDSATIGAGPACATVGTGCTFASFPSGTMFVFTPSSMPPADANLLVNSVSGVGGSVTPGSTYSMDVEVRNAGQASASFFAVQVNTEVFGSTTLIGEGSVNALGPGQSTIVTVSYTVPNSAPTGTYPIEVVVDPFGNVQESNEADNVYSAGFVTVGGGGQSITITTVSVPPGTVGSPYTFQIQQSGATSPSWSLGSGALPPGLSMSSSGRISGTPNTAGNFSFSVVCEQSGFTPGSMSYQLSITTATGFRISTTMLPQATVGQAYTNRIEAVGGQAPYAFQVVSGRPGWLIVSADGSLSGTPDGTGQHELRVSVFDSATMFTEGVVTLEVVQGGPLMLLTQPSDVVAGVVGLPYSVTLRAAGGMQPYSFQVSDGSLPGGLSLDGDTISGTPSAGGTANFEIRVSDAGGGSATGRFSIEVTERTSLVIDVQDSITVRPEVESEVELRATGGVPPYSWLVVGGSLPAGLSLDPRGFIRGTATATRATSIITLRVSDTQGESVDKSVTVEVRKATNNNNNGSPGGGGTRRDGGCATTAPTDGALISALMVLGWALARRRRAFLGAASVVEDEACPSRSSRGEPRSSRP